MKAKLFCTILIFMQSGLAMENPRKRPASEIASEQKEPKAMAVQYGTLDTLPRDLKNIILGYLITAQGVDDEEKLHNASQNIRNFLLLNKRFRSLLEDEAVAGILIEELAQRYAQGNIVHAAIELATEAAINWLANKINQGLRIRADGTIVTKRAENLPAPQAKIEQMKRTALAQDLLEEMDNLILEGKSARLSNLLKEIPILSYIHVLIDGKPQSLMRYAVMINDVELLEFLLEVPVPLDNEAVVMAVLEDDRDILEAFKKAGVDLKKNYRYGNIYGSLLFFSTTEEITKFLIDQGLDINGRNSIQRTPLHQAVVDGTQEPLEVLLEAGADPNVKDIQGDTPLHLAAFLKDDSKKIIKILLQNNANYTIANAEGNTPLAAAIIKRNVPAVTTLFKYGAQLPTIFYHGRPQSALKFALESFGEVDYETWKALLEALIANGAEVNGILIDPKTNQLMTYLRFYKNQPPSRANYARIQFLESHGAHE